MDEESVLKTPAGEIHRQEFDSLSLRQNFNSLGSW